MLEDIFNPTAHMGSKVYEGENLFKREKECRFSPKKINEKQIFLIPKSKGLTLSEREKKPQMQKNQITHLLYEYLEGKKKYIKIYI
jgi:hypothetical protein